MNNFFLFNSIKQTYPSNHIVPWFYIAITLEIIVQFYVLGDVVCARLCWGLIISFYYYYYTTSFFIIFISDREYDSHTNAKNCSSALIVLSFLFYVTWLRFCAYIVTLSRHQIFNFSDWRIMKIIIGVVFNTNKYIREMVKSFWYCVLLYGQSPKLLRANNAISYFHCCNKLLIA